MNNLWLGGPVRSLAFVVLGLLSSASTATADLVAQGVGAKPTTIASVGVSNEPERAGDFDRHAMSFETSSTQRSAHAHLQMAGDVPGAYELEFDVSIGSASKHRELNGSLHPFVGQTTDAGMRMKVDPRMYTGNGLLSVEIHNLDTETFIEVHTSYDEGPFELTLEPGTYRILIRGTTNLMGPSLEDENELQIVPLPSTLAGFCLLGCAIRRRRR